MGCVSVYPWLHVCVLVDGGGFGCLLVTGDYIFMGVVLDALCWWMEVVLGVYWLRAIISLWGWFWMHCVGGWRWFWVFSGYGRLLLYGGGFGCPVLVDGNLNYKPIC